MGLLNRLGALLADVVARTGPAAPAVLFFASFVEYVFPPFPGDTIVLLGAWYAVHGALSWPATFVAVTAGAVAGAVLDWFVGRAVGDRLDQGAVRGALDPARLAQFQASYRRYGAWLLLANRFLPGLRAFLFLAAGAARVPLRDVVLYGGVSAAAWNALLLGAGFFLAKNLAELDAIFGSYTRIAGALVATAVVFLVVRTLLRRRARGVAG